MDKKERKRYWYGKAIELQQIVGDRANRVRYEEQLSKLTTMFLKRHKTLLDSIKKAVADPKLCDSKIKPKGTNWEWDVIAAIFTNIAYGPRSTNDSLWVGHGFCPGTNSNLAARLKTTPTGRTISGRISSSFILILNRQTARSSYSR